MSESRACVIGAGLAGVAAARALSRRGLAFECFDRGEAIGGLAAGPGGGRLDVARERLQFSDWPMPRSYPARPGGRHLAAYLRDYAARLGLDAGIRLGVEVASASPRSGGGWSVRLGSGEQRRYDALVVAAGRRGFRRRPLSPPPGEFAGEQFEYDEELGEASLRDREVVVAGAGAAAAGLAVAASYVARSTHLSLQRPRYVLPQVAIGRAHDELPLLPYLLGKGVGPGRLSLQLPRQLRDRLLATAHRGLISHPLYGLPAPAEPPSAAGAVLAPHLLERLLHGRVAVQPGIAQLEGSHLRFAGGKRVRADLLVWCGSGRPRYPFLPAAAVEGGGGGPGLFWNVFRPGFADLAFVGLAEPDAGSPTAIAERQAELVAASVGGEYAPPPEREMWGWIAARRGGSGGDGGGGGLRVGEFDYAWRVRRELRAGRRRARLKRR